MTCLRSLLAVAMLRGDPRAVEVAVPPDAVLSVAAASAPTSAQQAKWKGCPPSVTRDAGVVRRQEQGWEEGGPSGFATPPLG